MTLLEKRLVSNYATVIMGKVMTIGDVPYRKIVMNDGTESNLREQVEIEIAKREIALMEVQ